MYQRKCEVCQQDFETPNHQKRICSFSCKQQAQRDRSRLLMRKVRQVKIVRPCILCGWDKTSDLHHEGNEIVPLCPNHHSMVTRGVVKSYKDIEI